MTRTVFHGGTVFDGTGAPAVQGDVLVEDGKIVDVGPQLDGDEGVDLSGKWVLPGFFDCHAHVMFGPQLVEYGPRSSNTPFSMRFYEAVDNLEATLRQGITTVRDAAGADLGVKHAVDRGRIRGPRMQISISMLSQTGGHADGWTLCGADLEMGAAYPGLPHAVVDGPDEMRRKVRELVRAGADVIKVATSGGVLSPRDDPRHGHFRDDELDGARRRGHRSRQVRDGPRTSDRRHQGRRPHRRPVDRARHLPRRRGDPDDARPRHVPRADAVRAARRLRRTRRGHPGPGRLHQEVRDGDRGPHRVDPSSDRGGRQGRDGHRLRCLPARSEPHGSSR